MKTLKLKALLTGVGFCLLSAGFAQDTTNVSGTDSTMSPTTDTTQWPKSDTTGLVSPATQQNDVNAATATQPNDINATMTTQGNDVTNVNDATATTTMTANSEKAQKKLEKAEKKEAKAEEKREKAVEAEVEARKDQ